MALAECQQRMGTSALNPKNQSLPQPECSWKQTLLKTCNDAQAAGASSWPCETEWKHWPSPAGSDLYMASQRRVVSVTCFMGGE